MYIENKSNYQRVIFLGSKVRMKLFHILLTSLIWFTYNEYATFKIKKPKNWMSTYKKMKLDSYLLVPTKINSKQIKYLNVQAKTINLFEENIGEKLHDIGFGTNFLTMTPKAKATKERDQNFIEI